MVDSEGKVFLLFLANQISCRKHSTDLPLRQSNYRTRVK